VEKKKITPESRKVIADCNVIIIWHKLGHGNEGNEKGKETDAALGRSNRPEGGNRDDQWPVQSPESRNQRCRSLSQGFPFPLLLTAFASTPKEKWKCRVSMFHGEGIFGFPSL